MIWNVNPEIFTFGGLLVIRWYGTFFAIAFISGFQIKKWLFKIERIDLKYLDGILIYIFIGTIVGARLGHCLFYEPNVYLYDPLRIFKIWEGGLASHGGMLGILTALYFAAQKYKMPSYLWLLNRTAIPAALGSGFIRLGNLFNSEIIGHPTNVPWALTLPAIEIVNLEKPLDF